MEQLVICGGSMLNGTVDIHGAKNSILPILAACVLCPRRCVIARCPDISDLHTATDILRHLGCRVEKIGGAVLVDGSPADETEIPPELMARMRASVNFLGALLARFGRCTLSLPGGCCLGERPIDYHVASLEQLGVTMEEEGEKLRFLWPKKRGGEITLPFPSVGATENVVLAATAVPGQVILHNAAKEPEIVDLCRFLCAMGAEIAGAGTETIVINGQKNLQGTVYTVMPDRMEAATYLAMAAACGGKVRLRGVEASHLAPVLDVFRRAGCRIETKEKEILLCSTGCLVSPGEIETAAYPGFPTDAQAPVMAALLRAEGKTVFRETVFSSRFQHVAELRKLGADISVSGSEAVVRGVKRLRGTDVLATDLRGGAGVIIAALQAEGQSTVDGVCYVHRGYAELTDNLRKLGAKVTDREPKWAL